MEIIKNYSLDLFTVLLGLFLFALLLYVLSVFQVFALSGTSIATTPPIMKIPETPHSCL